MVGALVWMIVAVAASGPDPDGETWLGTSNLDLVTTAVVVTPVVAGVAALLPMVRLRRRDWVQRSAKGRRRPLAAGALLLVWLLIVWRADLLEQFIERLRGLSSEETEAAPVAPDGEFAPTSGPAPETVAEARDLFAVVLLAVVIAAAVWWSRRGPEALDATTAEIGDRAVDADELRLTVDAATSQLAGDATDPRTRVLLAYESLEQHLGERGLPRRRSETASEHLQRSIGDLGGDPEPFVALGALYERARFSHTTIAEDQVRDAARHLERALPAQNTST